MADVNIRDARPEDATAIAGLVRQLGFADNPDTIARRLEQLQGAPFFHAWVAQVAGHIVGVLTLQILPYLNTDRDGAQIVLLVVDHEHRRQGIGSALVRTAEELAEELGCCNVKLFTDRGRVEAHAFYEMLGYRVDTGKTRFVKNLAE